MNQLNASFPRGYEVAPMRVMTVEIPHNGKISRGKEYSGRKRNSYIVEEQIGGSEMFMKERGRSFLAKR